MNKHHFIPGNLKSAWLLSYVMVLLIPFILFIINYNILFKSVEEKITYSNDIILQNVQQKSDLMFKEVKSFDSQLIQNPYLQSLVNSHYPISSEARLCITELQQQLLNYKKLDFPIDLFFIYINNLDIVITSDATFSSEDFFNYLNFKDNTSLDDWKAAISDSSRPYKIFNTQINNSVKTMLTTSQTIPADGDNKKASLVSVIDVNNLFPVFDTISDDKGAVFILDNGRPVLSLPQNSKYSRLDFEHFADNPSGITNTYIGNQKLVVSHIDSDIRDMAYVYVVPYTTFWSETIKIIIMSVIEIMLLILLSVIIVKFFIKLHYEPIGDILNSAKNLSNDAPEKMTNELNFIKDTIVKAALKDKEANRRLYRQNKILANNFLAELLLNKITDTKSFYKKMEEYDIHLNSDAFCVMLIHIDDASRLFSEYENGERENSGTGSSEKLALCQTILSNIVHEITAETYDNYPCIIDNNVAFIVNITGPVSNAGKSLSEAARKAFAAVGENFDIDFSVYIGSCCSSPEEIHSSYEDASTAMSYKFIMYDKNIICFEDIIPHITNEYLYSYDTEQLLVNSIKSGNYESSVQIIKNIFDENFNAGGGNFILLQASKCLIFDIVSTIVKTGNGISTRADMNFIETLHPFEMLVECTSITEAEDRIIYLLKEICCCISAENNSGSLKSRAESFVRENYTDINLSVSSIADELGVNVRYLSSLYKKQSEDGLQNYISKVRIEKAVELLKTTDENILTIAESVGYSNIRTFSRVFKKFTGTTPSQYKEINS